MPKSALWMGSCFALASLALVAGGALDAPALSAVAGALILIAYSLREREIWRGSGRTALLPFAGLLAIVLVAVIVTVL